MKILVISAIFASSISYSPLDAKTRCLQIDASVKKFEESKQFPEGALPINKYARYYKLVNLTNKSKIRKIVHFVYLSRNIRPGIYILRDHQDVPNDALTDGGCRTIEGFYSLKNGVVLSIHCAPQR